jgi:hypothetical protein
MPQPNSSRNKDGFNLKAHFKTEWPNARSSGTGKGRGQRVYVCLHCTNRWESNWSSNAITHARNKHPQQIQDQEDSQATSSYSFANTQTSMGTYITSMASSSSLRNAFNAQQYNEAIVGLLTRRRVPFSAVEWNEVKSLALACNPAIEDCLITNRRAAMRIIDANYGLYQSQLKDLLQESQSMIHLSTDLWTSPHRHGMLAVCAQWVDKNYGVRKALLGMPECPYSHSGSTQAGLIMDIIYKFGISRIGYHIGDNATSNDTCLEALATRLKAEREVCCLPPRVRALTLMACCVHHYYLYQGWT